MIIELHSHTAQHSTCSRVAAADLVRGCIEQRVQGLVLTDHHYVWPPQELAGLRHTASVPEHFVLLSGQEVTTADLGDILVYGADTDIPRGTSLDEIRRRFPRAALVLAHPYRNGRIPGGNVLRHPALDAVEIFNANHKASENYRALQDWRRYKFNAVSGTDVHAAGYCATYPTIFDHFVRSVDELAREIRAGRCRPLLREKSHAGTSNLRVTELDFGCGGKTGPSRRLIVKSHADRPSLRAGSRAHDVMAAIAAAGFRHGTYRIPAPLGKEERHLALLEEAVEGASLFDTLQGAPGKAAGRCLALAARWLARLHTARLHVTPADEFLNREPDRLGHYTSILQKVDHPHTRRIKEIAEAVLAHEAACYGGRPDRLVQGHGDYHPKNIFIGRDRAEDPDSLFAAAIDFDSSLQLPPAFDVGTFLAQYRNQLHPYPHILEAAPPDVFVDAYLEATGRPREAFMLEAELFQARTALSIIYYLVKVGKGASENLWRVLLDAERALTRFAAGRETRNSGQ